MKYPKVNIITDITGDFEARYICFLAKNISLGTYQNGGFLVLPSLEKGNSHTVHFPNLPYSKDFWQKIAFNSNKNLSGDFPKSAVDEVKKLLLNYKKESFKKEVEKIKSDWLKIEDIFFNDVEKFLDFKKALSKVNNINILITPFGTLGSFNPPRIGNKFNLNVTSRVDFPAGNIAHGILQNLYIIDSWVGGEIGDENYVKRMSAISFVFENTIFKKYYPNFINLTKPKYTINQALSEKSKKYLKKLGFASKDLNLSESLKNLTKQEEKVIEILADHKGKIVTFDQVARCIWGKGVYDKFSLEAMAKVIENLRKKIKKLGINKEVIFIKRSKGYFMN